MYEFEFCVCMGKVVKFSSIFLFVLNFIMGSSSVLLGFLYISKVHQPNKKRSLTEIGIIISFQIENLKVRIEIPSEDKRIIRFIQFSIFVKNGADLGRVS